ncbi:hypothetical protein CsatB_008485 [Cannabis sativa]|uniref:TF-B3 domain-containing protein n=1 Tax=Cannabis sativa TaxID=3483 RepID=A0A7J6H115_CANSA|nr:putative B3 domain-containing protein At5g58280 [Cannabis sativa]KAF4373136.1 hypothetical protein F8388_019318 [Cannabis sativa]KAF4388320.1 hypothetical protein G4B88_013157 [Cannabis sativa]
MTNPSDETRADLAEQLATSLKMTKPSDEARAATKKRAEEFMSGFKINDPKFWRSMIPSAVNSVFLLRLPGDFCTKNLPNKEDKNVVILIDKNGEEYKTVYLAKRAALSGGWKAFALAHNLMDGDVLLFKLIRPSVFEVFIFRVNDPEQWGYD